MTYSISLKIQPTTYQRFETIHQKLNEVKQKVSPKP
jgi:hypothetical protein